MPSGHRQPLCQVSASDISSHKSYGPDSKDIQTDEWKVIKG